MRWPCSRPREREILECLAQGMTRTQIVERFTLSPHTVRTHIGRVLTKLEVHNTLSAVSIARKAGLAAEDRMPSSSHLRSVRAADTADRMVGRVYLHLTHLA